MIKYIRVRVSGDIHVLEAYDELGNKYGQHNFYRTPTREAAIQSAQRRYRVPAADDVVVQLPGDNTSADQGEQS